MLKFLSPEINKLSYSEKHALFSSTAQESLKLYLKLKLNGNTIRNFKINLTKRQIQNSDLLSIESLLQQLRAQRNYIIEITPEEDAKIKIKYKRANHQDVTSQYQKSIVLNEYPVSGQQLLQNIMSQIQSSHKEQQLQKQKITDLWSVTESIRNETKQIGKILEKDVDQMNELLTKISAHRSPTKKQFESPATASSLKNSHYESMQSIQQEWLEQQQKQIQSLQVLSQNKLIEPITNFDATIPVKEMNLRSKQLTKIPYQIYDFKKLEKLYLSSNLLKLIPPEIGKFQELKDLRVSKNMIAQLPKQLWKLTKLQILYLQKNQIQSISSEIVYLKQLRELSVYDNQIVSLPKGLVELKKLRKLSIGDNPIRQIPQIIWKMTNLQILDISKTNLRQISKEIKHLTGLRKLYATDNGIEFLPSELCSLKKLQFISCGTNPIKELPKQFINLQNLKQLLLGQCQFSQMPQSIKFLPKLKNLWIYSNRIRTLPEWFFQINFSILMIHENQLNGESIAKLNANYDKAFYLSQFKV